MKLQALSLSDLETVRLWRNENLAMLRTPFLLTLEMQADFYHNVVCNRQAYARYWAIVGDNNQYWCKDGNGSFIPGRNSMLIGMCGLENISWENRSAEISIIMDPEIHGYGEQAVDMLLDQGFNCLNLENIYGECYECCPAIGFWNKMNRRHKAIISVLPKRKYWQGRYCDSLYFNYSKGAYNENTVSIST
ncbi:MAG: GNAT family protein [Smithella sp.]|jgi:RimJ/RimL family protein N-acetyltransferase